MKITVENFEWVKNQFLIQLDDKTIFQSYQTVMAYKHLWIITLKTNYNISRTTSKYLYIFLWMNRNEIKKAIKDWIIILEDELEIY